MMIPNFVSLKNWSHSLIIDFPSDNIPVLMDEENWKTWGNHLIQENSFSKNGAPSTKNYPDWKSWAKDIFKVMVNN